MRLPDEDPIEIARFNYFADGFGTEVEVVDIAQGEAHKYARALLEVRTAAWHTLPPEVVSPRKVRNSYDPVTNTEDQAQRIYSAGLRRHYVAATLPETPATAELPKVGARRLAGFGKVVGLQCDRLDDSRETRPKAMIEALDVHPSQKGRGIGTILMGTMAGLYADDWQPERGFFDRGKHLWSGGKWSNESDIIPATVQYEGSSNHRKLNAWLGEFSFSKIAEYRQRTTFEGGITAICHIAAERLRSIE